MKVAVAFLEVVLTLIISANVYGAGEIRHYKVAEKGQSYQKTLSVYLPEGYEASALPYPVLYLLHDSGGDNLTFLGKGYIRAHEASLPDGVMRDANAALIADRLLSEKKILPFIIVCPNIEGTSSMDVDYLMDTIVPFIDSTLRTIPKRESRAIAGHCNGGFLALYVGLKYYETFGVIGGFSSLVWRAYFRDQLDELVKQSKGKDRSSLIWLSEGLEDIYCESEPNKDFAAFLNQNGLQATYTADNGDHYSKVADRLSDFLRYASVELKR